MPLDVWKMDKGLLNAENSMRTGRVRQKPEKGWGKVADDQRDGPELSA